MPASVNPTQDSTGSSSAWPGTAAGAIADATTVEGLRAALARLPAAALRSMRAAADEAAECRRVLRKAGLNLVGEVLRGQGDFVELEHYPRDDVFDREMHSQYYYHAHRGSAVEHGHFHTFLRAGGMPPGAAPVAERASEPWPRGADALSHLVAISMDGWGDPIGLFTTNRWVTDETWYPAPEVVRMLERFRIDHAAPSWPVNRWIGAMLVLFRPQIVTLLQRRDEVVAGWQAAHPGQDVYEDRGLDVTSQVAVDVQAQRDAIVAALGEAARWHA